MSVHFCKSALNVRGEHFPCDWPTDFDGSHDGWAHSNQNAQAIWSSVPVTILPEQMKWLRESIAEQIDARYKEAADRHDIDKDQNSEGQKYAFDIAEQIARGDL